MSFTGGEEGFSGVSCGGPRGWAPHVAEEGLGDDPFAAAWPIEHAEARTHEINQS